ncbi:4-hydroxy-tetrahydrodipicolinate synthase [Calidifontibacillus erzurumensis]|uniref:4-hydroxy-tetrahydrodipicolinate synthase n=1 Tax=Calidifontibacillus erzurumensis TaxID=2741433 RepID=A0A8J8KBJ7_9BACI|nr:4-hydroxy-tetrahydrodipicolinate synthase [Calidifontibacillus erzurumensis]NSL51128.1 4-hydroxy-tetrahydrodipicolinate synthase [Calidifontibacillus erzurumensis]
MMVFGRIGTAMVTPFDANGNIDFDKTTELVNYLIENGTDSLIVAGTTGESPTLSKEEKVALYRHVVAVVNGRVPVVAGTGSNDTKSSIELTKKAEEAGVDGIMLVAPYYNKPDQDGLYEHFKAIAGETNLPIMLYNIPGRCGVNISVDTIVKLAQIKNIVAVKEASGDLNAMAEIISRTDDDFYLYTGDDSNTLPVLAIGGRGVISVASHIIGKEMQEMITLFEKGEVKKAAKLHQRLLPIMKGLFIGPNPVPVKYALKGKGIDVGSVRLPLVPLQKEKQLIIDELLKQY